MPMDRHQWIHTVQIVFPAALPTGRYLEELEGHIKNLRRQGDKSPCLEFGFTLDRKFLAEISINFAWFLLF